MGHPVCAEILSSQKSFSWRNTFLLWSFPFWKKLNWLKTHNKKVSLEEKLFCYETFYYIFLATWELYTCMVGLFFFFSFLFFFNHLAVWRHVCLQCCLASNYSLYNEWMKNMKTIKSMKSIWKWNVQMKSWIENERMKSIKSTKIMKRKRIIKINFIF